MKAANLFRDQENTYIHLERYVNDGSPSGFTEVHTTSDRTNPFRGEDRFPLLAFADADLKVSHLGRNDTIINSDLNFVHPDSINSKVLTESGRKVFESEVVVSPTSSARTMMIRDSESKGFIKLTYDIARLGRVDRQLSLNHCLSCIEVTETLRDRIDKKMLPETFALFSDVSARVTNLELGNEIYEWGVVFREQKPYPYSDNKVQIVPGFSLFGSDKRNPQDELLITQLVDLSGINPRNYIVDLLKMIVDAYWGVVVQCAFNLECQAQNSLFEVDEDYKIVRFVYRDMDSVDKDIPLAKHLGLKHDWESCPHSCFDESDYNYTVRSSYIYDFKVGEYLLSPLLDTVATKYRLSTQDIQTEIREHVQTNHLSKLPSSYFPEDRCWYVADNTERMPGQKRKYFAKQNPKFR